MRDLTVGSEKPWWRGMFVWAWAGGQLLSGFKPAAVATTLSHTYHSNVSTVSSSSHTSCWPNPPPTHAHKHWNTPRSLLYRSGLWLKPGTSGYVVIFHSTYAVTNNPFAKHSAGCSKHTGGKRVHVSMQGKTWLSLTLSWLQRRDPRKDVVLGP